MRRELLNMLRCPFCGGRLWLQQGQYHERDGDVAAGILCCPCCAYPVVAGIPYLCLDDSAEKAMRLLGKGEQEKAFFTLLDLRGARQRQFERLLENERTLTWNGALEILSPGGEGNYFLYRFSDPTFLCGQAVVQAVGRDQRRLPGPVLDLCGGAGHLTRSLCRLAGARQVILADNTFWEVW